MFLHFLTKDLLNGLYYLITDEYICGEELDTPSGEFGYINDDMLEGVDLDCEWNIIARENQPIYLKIIHFQLNRTEQCADTYLMVSPYL